MHSSVARDDGGPQMQLVGVRVTAERPVHHPAPERDWKYVAVLCTAMVLGVFLRLTLTDSATFPLGDGGMFYRMVSELLANRLIPPFHTTFNHAAIPFAYPLFGFYVIALLHLATGIEVLTLMRWVPPVICCLSLGAFSLLATALLRSRLAQVAAVTAFALLPDSFMQEIKGGGITRAWGELFCLMSLYCLARLLQRNDRRYLLPSGVFAGLTIVSHLEWAWFLAYSAIVLWFFFASSRRVRLGAGTVALIAAVVAAPWWARVLHRYGIGVILSIAAGARMQRCLASCIRSSPSTWSARSGCPFSLPWQSSVQ